MSGLSNILNNFQKPSSGSAWWDDFQISSFENLKSVGFPSQKVESWKYLPVRSLLQDLENSQELKPIRLKPEACIDKYAARLVFVNGVLQTNLLQIKDSNIEIQLFSESINSPELKKCLSFKDFNHSFSLLNDIASDDGVFIHIKEDLNIEKPILIENFGYSEQTENSHFFKKLAVFVGKNTSVNILEHNFLDSPFVTAISSCIKYLQIGAKLNCYTLNRENDTSRFINMHKVLLESSASYNSIYYDNGSKLSRQEQCIELLAPNAEAKLEGLYVSDTTRTLNHSIQMKHNVPNCTSSQRFKGILNDRAKVFFDGLVYVAPGADFTESNQINRNILLSDASEVDTKPQLEIYADDVSCNHGASLGQLSREELFYLMSRGISKEESIAMLAYAFAEEVLETIDNHEIHDLFISHFEADISEFDFEVES